MSSVEGLPVIQYFADISGKSLDDGFVYIGTSGLDPVANPISVFWDAALTIPAPNPIRTRNGHPDRSGVPARFFVDTDSYSFAVKNKNGTTVYTALDSLSASDFERRLRNDTDASKGSGIVGFVSPWATGVADSVYDKLIVRRDLHDFLTKAERADALTGNPTIDLTTKIQAVLDGLPEGSCLRDDTGSTYLVDTLSLTSKNFVTIDLRSRLKCPTGGTGGFRVVSCQRSKVFVHRFLKGSGAPADFDLLTGAIMTVLQCSNCDIGFTRGENYRYAWYVSDATGGGTFFCNFYWSNTQFCKFGVYVAVEDAANLGFVNGNRWIGGEIRCQDAGLKTVKGALQTDPFNGNEFLFHIEQCGNAIDLDFAHNNYFRGRLEGSGGSISGRYVKCSNTCQGNTYQMFDIPLDRIEANGKIETFLGPVRDNSIGTYYGTNMVTSQAGGRINILAYDFAGSTPTTSNGVPVRTYIYNTDQVATSALDQGVTGLLIRDGSGDRRIRLREDGTIDAINVSVDLPYLVSVVRVNTSASAVDLRMKTGDFYTGKQLMIEVTNFTNAIRIRNQADTLDLLAAGIINSAGMWHVYVSSGLGMRATKLS